VTTFGTVARQGGGWLPLLGAADLLATLTMLGLPMALGRVIDGIVAGGDGGRWLALAAGLIALGVVCELVRAFVQPLCVAGITAWLRNSLIRHVCAIGPQASRRFDSGDLVSRLSGNAVDAAQAGPSLVQVGTAVLPPLGSLVLLVYIDIWLAVAFFAGLGLVALVLQAFTRRSTEVNIGYQQTQGRIAARLAESLTGARTIAAAGTLDREERRVLEQLPDLHEQGKRLWLVFSRSIAQAAVVGPLVLVAVLAAGGLELVHGRISPGELFAASQYAVIGAGIGGLTAVFSGLARARAGVRRVAEVLTVPPVHYGGRALPAGPGQLEFRMVTVRAGDTILLDRIDLDLPGGAAVALVGRSGAGKSVLAALAARLRDPDEGQVLLDGVPLSELSHRALRAAIGCAFERPVLVGTTVAEAVGMGRDLAQVRSAAQATHAHEFVSRLPRGYDTPLADAPMSGGEIQRLGLARAWQAERLLVLDDATSSLDMVTEMQISQTLIDGKLSRTTRLIATHRVSTAARADLVVWLEDGRVRAVGPHAQLWAEPAYREVYG
jgi:ATP-binding cassette, subfamily B, bacterial